MPDKQLLAFTKSLIPVLLLFGMYGEASAQQAVVLGTDAPCAVTLPNGVVAGSDRRTPQNYGNQQLSVVLWPDGTVVFKPFDGSNDQGFVTRDGSLGMMFNWFVAVRGQLTVEGRRLDAPAPPLRTEAWRDFELNPMPTRLIFPSPGCWEVTGRIGETALLTFVTRVVKVGNGAPAIEGEVVDESGAPIAGANVSSDRAGARTDNRGSFAVERGDVIDFQASGYRPVTMLSSEFDARPVVRMRKDSQSVWRAPECRTVQLSPDANGVQPVTVLGNHMRFVVPSGAKIERVSDIDYHENVVCLEHDCLEHGFGPLWSSGTVMRAQFFTGLRQITQREMYDVPNQLVFGREYRGVRNDGTHFRWVGVINETISYEHTSPQSARVFDTLIDSLCWSR